MIQIRVSQMGTDPLHNVLRAEGPGLMRHFTPSAKQHHGWDTLNAEAGPQRLFPLRVPGERGAQES